MAAHSNWQAIIFCSCVLSCFSHPFSAVGNWMSTILSHDVALVQIYNAGLKCAACGWLKHRTQKIAKNRHLRTITQICRAVSSQLRHISTIGKKLNSNISSTRPHNMANFGSLTAEIFGSGVCGTPANFNGFRFLLSLLQRRRWRRSTKLCTMFVRLPGWYTIYTFSGALAP